MGRNPFLLARIKMLSLLRESMKGNKSVTQIFPKQAQRVVMDGDILQLGHFYFIFRITIFVQFLLSEFGNVFFYLIKFLRNVIK